MGREGQQGFFEACCHIKALLRRAGELECYDMFYHNVSNCAYVNNVIGSVCRGLRLGIKALACGGYFLVGDVVVIFCHFVNYAARGEFYDAVAYGLYELMVV